MTFYIFDLDLPFDFRMIYFISTYQNELHFQFIFFIEPNLRDGTQVTVD